MFFYLKISEFHPMSGWDGFHHYTAISRFPLKIFRL